MMPTLREREMFISKKKYIIVFVCLAFLIGVLILFLTSSFSVSIYELPGKYIVEHEFATEIITIKDDGEFVHEVRVIGSNNADTKKGLWKYFKEDGCLRFDSNYMVVVDGRNKFVPDYAKPRPPNDSSWPDVYKLLGSIYISRGDRKPYKKVTSK